LRILAEYHHEKQRIDQRNLYLIRLHALFST